MLSPRPWPRRPAASLLAALCLSVCTLPQRIQADDKTAEGAAAGTPQNPPPAASPELQQALPAIAADAAEGMTGDVATAQADQQALAPARSELEKAEVRTGLSTDQAQQLRAAQAQLGAGHAAAALILLQALNAELEGDARSYTVQPGDSLPMIAARNDVYANSRLWPLVAEANREHLRQGGRLRAGEVLAIPAHPTIEDVTTAQEYARGHKPQNGPAVADR